MLRKFSAVILQALAKNHEIAAVYTKKDSIRRGKNVESPVAAISNELGLKLEKPDNLKDSQTINVLTNYRPDCICVAAYGLILPKAVLEIPQFGCINVHASLLPQWRGAAPMQRSILSGQKWTGISIMQMEEGLDTGPYCKQLKLEARLYYLPDLEDKLASLGAKALLDALQNLETGNLEFTVQEDSQATYAEKIANKELYPRCSDTALNALDKVRASDFSNPSRCKLAGREVRLLKVAETSKDIEKKLDDAFANLEQSQALVYFEKKLYMGFSDSWLELCKLVPAGKNAMDAKAFAAGLQGIKQTASSWEELL